MKDSDQTKNIPAVLVTILTLLLGYKYVQGNWENPRPAEPQTSIQVPIAPNTHQVAARLWQDPFECFEASTNPAAAGLDKGGGTNSTVPPDGYTNLWYEITKHEPGRADADQGSIGERTVILGVMLEGGPYADEKEVRLRTRYAVLMALLSTSKAGRSVTVDFRPEDRNHIYTNSVRLTTGQTDTNGIASEYAYEWFQTINQTNNSQNARQKRICVVWLNEDDFGDSPGLRLGSLLGQLPLVVPGNTNTSFYLIGPRSSDTLRALANTDTNSSPNYLNLTGAARQGTFQILSPEATACIADDNEGDEEDKITLTNMNRVLGTNAFHNWIATDQQIATLISEELSHRIRMNGPKTNNVVVLLSEQDTYYGSKLADEWSAALVGLGLRGLGQSMAVFVYARFGRIQTPGKTGASTAGGG